MKRGSSDARRHLHNIRRLDCTHSPRVRPYVDLVYLSHMIAAGFLLFWLSAHQNRRFEERNAAVVALFNKRIYNVRCNGDNMERSPLSRVSGRQQRVCGKVVLQICICVFGHSRFSLLNEFVLFNITC